MDIQVVENEYCKLNITYEASLDQIEEKRMEVLTSFKKAPVKGFREGRASIEVIKIYYKKQIEDSLKRALMEAAYHTVIFEKDIKALGQPNFSNVLLNGNKFTCTFDLNKKPDFTLAQYKDFEIPKPATSITVEALTEKYLEECRVQYGEQVPFQENDFIQMGDHASIQYEGFLDGLKHDNLSSDGDLLTVGANPIKEFDEALLGMKIGETREFDIVVPSTSLPTYAGRTIRFVATLVMASKIRKMPLDDSLATKVGKGNLDELRSFLAGIAASKIQDSERVEMAKQISARLIANHDFKVPQWLSLSEAQYLASSAKVEWEKISDADKEKFLDQGGENVKLALILDRIREEEPDAQLSDQEVIDIIKNNLQKNNTKNENLDETLLNMNKSGYLQVLLSRIRDEHTLDFIRKTVKIIE